MFGVPASLTQVLSGLGIHEPTPIQAATLTDAIAGRDVLGRGRTGSGKTYAFLLPLVTRLAAARTQRRSRHPRALILAPTRELANQIDAALQPLAAATGLRSRTVFGGVGQGPQVRALQTGVDVVVACPGRLEDLIAQGACSLDQVEITVVDEADHMADLGFLPAVTRLLGQTPRSGQRLLFSATLDKGIDGLVKRFLRDPAVHHADSPQARVPDMTHHLLHVRPTVRTDVLVDLAAAAGRTLIFTRTKSRAKALTRQLNQRGVPAVELHGNLSQNARTRSMDAFHAGRVQTLVATDIAARGIHVDDVELVVHADPPAEAKAYVHRSGRTARAGKRGTVVTLMTDDQVRDVSALARAAGIRPTATVVDSVTHPVLRVIAPEDRRFETVAVASLSTSSERDSQRAGTGRRRSGRTDPKRTSNAAQPKGRSTGAVRRSSPAPAKPGTASTRPNNSTRRHTASDFSRRVRAR